MVFESSGAASITPVQIAAVSACMKCMKTKIFDHANTAVLKYVYRGVFLVTSLIERKLRDV